MIRDEQGRVLLVDPAYSKTWDLPGGSVDAEESPHAACWREVSEEIGIERPRGRILAVDWVASRPERPEGVIMIYDGGVLTAEDITLIAVADEELAGFSFVPPDEIPALVTPVLARRIAACLEALETGTVAVLDNGGPAYLRAGAPLWMREPLPHGTQDSLVIGDQGSAVPFDHAGDLGQEFIRHGRERGIQHGPRQFAQSGAHHVRVSGPIAGGLKFPEQSIGLLDRGHLRHEGVRHRALRLNRVRRFERVDQRTDLARRHGIVEAGERNLLVSGVVPAEVDGGV